jgi:hypothetical protein
MTQRPHNRLKLPLFVAGAVAGLAALVVAVVSGPAWYALFGVGMIAASAYPIVLIRRGENPRWLQAPLDPKPVDEPARSEKPLR